MKLKFKATRKKPKHRGRDLYFKNGDIREVNVERGEKLLIDFPDNFFIVSPQRVTKKTVVGRFPPLKKIIPPTPSSEEYHPPLRKPLNLSDITVIVINPYPELFKTHFLPCIPSEVEFLPLENIKNINWTSAAPALNYGIDIASNDIVICAHPDLVFGRKWFESFIYHEARLDNWGALGFVGWDLDNKLVYGNKITTPYKIQCLDECCVIVNRKNKLRFDQDTFTSWHCHGADFSLQCIDKGLGVYVIPGVASHGGYSFIEVPGFVDERDKTLPILWNKWKGKVSSINMGLPQSKIRGEK